MTAPSFDIYAPDLRAALGRIKHAMASEEARPILCSFVIDKADDGFRVYAADGYRIAMQSIETTNESGDWPQTVVARDGVPVLLDALAAAGKADVTVERRPERLWVKSAVGTVEVRLVDGRFPDIDTAMPSDPGPILAAFNPAYLMDAGRAAKSALIVHVHSTGPLAPAAVKSDDGFTEWIMPVKTVEVSRV